MIFAEKVSYCVELTYARLKERASKRFLKNSLPCSKSSSNTIDGPLLEELFPLGNILSDVHWEAHDGRTRLPSHLTEEHTAEHLEAIRELLLVVKLVPIRSS